MYIYAAIRTETEAQAIFLTPFTVCSSCKWKQIEVIRLQKYQMDLPIYANHLGPTVLITFSLCAAGYGEMCWRILRPRGWLLTRLTS